MNNISDCFSGYNDWITYKWKQNYYNISSICYSYNGLYSIGCDSNGIIAIFSLQKYLSSEYWLSSSKPLIPTSIIHFKAHYDPIHSLLVTKEYIISASEMEIYIWSWDLISNNINEIGNNTNESKLITLKPLKIFRINSTKLFELSNDNTLFYLNSLGSIYELNIFNDNQVNNEIIPNLSWINISFFKYYKDDYFIIGYTDDTVRIWKNGKICYELFENHFTSISLSLEDYIKSKNNSMKSSIIKGNITCIELDSSGDWLAFGSSRNYISIWNISLKAFTNGIPLAGMPKKIIFNGTDIISIGSEEYVYHWNITGNYKFRVKSSSQAVSDININTNALTQYKILLSCGESNLIDVYPTFSHKSFSFKFPSLK